jgi:hypothetical protein
MILSAHALQAMQVRFKSVSNEGDFTLEAQRVFRLYLHQCWGGITEEYDMVPITHVP